MHHFLNIYLREGDLIIVSETPRDLPLCNIDHITLTVVYTVVILVTSCMTACTLQIPGKLRMCNKVYSLLVPEVPFINLLHCIVFSVSRPNSVLQVQFPLHYHHASLCLSADCTSVVQFQLRRNPAEPQQFSRIQLCVQ